MSTNIYGKAFYEPFPSTLRDRLEQEYQDALRYAQLGSSTRKLDMSADGLNARLLELESRMNNLYTKLEETNKMNEYLQEIINDKL